MNKELLHRMAHAAKEFGETVWMGAPSAVIQFSVWTAHVVDEVVVGYTGEQITTRIGHEERESSEVFQRLRSEIDKGSATGEESDLQ